MRKISPSDRILLEGTDHPPGRFDCIPKPVVWMPIEIEERMREWAKLGWIDVVRCEHGHEHAQLTAVGREAIRLQDIADGKIPA